MREVGVAVKTFDRHWALERSLPQVAGLGAPVLVVDDGSGREAAAANRKLAREHGCAYLALPSNRGNSCTLNVAVSYWLADPVVEWISVFEDDVDVRSDTLSVLGQVQEAVARPLLTGFLAWEHLVLARAEVAGVQTLLQRSARSTHLHAHRDYWRSVFPVPTHYLGAPKPSGGRPNQACDSDWWVTAWAPRSVTKLGGYVTCVPGLVEHFAENVATSTWANPTWAGRMSSL